MLSAQAHHGETLVAHAKVRWLRREFELADRLQRPRDIALVLARVDGAGRVYERASRLQKCRTDT